MVRSHLLFCGCVSGTLYVMYWPQNYVLGVERETVHVGALVAEIFMKLKTILLSTLAAVALINPIVAHSYEYGQEETQKLITSMIRDLGGHDSIRPNSGKTMRCVYGGTKKVSILQKDGVTRYTAEYGNCRENSSIRDGIYEIVLQGDEIVTSRSRRSRNGDLFDAALAGNAGKVRELIKAKADVNYTESVRKAEGGGYIEEWTPLMSAVAAESLETVKTLVSAGAWVNYLNNMAVNALWIASNIGNTEIVRYLVKHGAYLNNSNKDNVTPLMTAVMNGHLEVVKILVASKAQLNLGHNDGDTALMIALAGGRTEIARLLVDAGADVNVRNHFGTTALHIAAAEGNLEMVNLLIKRKADLTARTDSGFTALDVAKAKGHTAIVELLEKASQ